MPRIPAALLTTAPCAALAAALSGCTELAPLSPPEGDCPHGAGARVEETLGLDAAARAAIPIRHLVIVTQENRSFDHLFGTLQDAGQPDAEGWPASFTNPDVQGKPVAPFHLSSTCLPADPPHQWDGMHDGWDGGKMDGFVRSAAVKGQDGHYVMGYYDESDLPFYHWLATTFAVADRHFAPSLAGTWPNRDYLYAATSGGVTDTGFTAYRGPNIFDALDEAGVAWSVYTDGYARQNCLGWSEHDHPGVAPFQAFLDALAKGTLPPVAFVDPGPAEDEHPPHDVQRGESWARAIYDAAIASPLWPQLAILYTYDEAGGLADHVPPPPACLPTLDQHGFERRGMRVPAVLISPWSRPHFVSHVPRDHTSALRLIEALHDLPALTRRDANADALLDMFDFTAPALSTPPPAPDPGKNGCPGGAPPE
jgi:phospholipase C